MFLTEHSQISLKFDISELILVDVLYYCFKAWYYLAFILAMFYSNSLTVDKL